MRKLVGLMAIATALTCYNGNAQTIFTYGKERVSAEQFLRAWQKNNTQERDEKALREYLDLYIASRLKIKEARAAGIDTLPQIRADLANLRQQIIPSYVNDKAAVQRLVEEAFVRSQKDIKLAHIFFSSKDEQAAKKKLDIINTELAKNPASFFKLAQEYSEDPAAKDNGGNMGWITVFTLPYELENLAYATRPGKPSGIYQSRSGYHILYNIEERPAVGRVKAAEILLAFPPDADQQTKAGIKKLADSLYTAIAKGAEFEVLAERFSNDVISSASKGLMMEFGVGQYDPVFENTVFGLNEGAISPPFLTSHGYHIVKLLSRTPVGNNRTDEKTIADLKEKVEQSDRIGTIQSEQAKKILAKLSAKEPVDSKELQAFVDSSLDHKKPPVPLQIKGQSLVLQLNGQKTTANDWLQFAQLNRFRPNGGGLKPMKELWQQFREAEAMKYYQDHLEEYNEDFRRQLAEFEEGNLFFEIMQQKVWTPAQTDSLALVKYFEKNRTKYTWKESADAIIFFTPNEGSATHFITHLASPSSWKTAVATHSDITTDSARFEWSQIPNSEKVPMKEGVLTPVLVNKNDNTASFAYILKIYTQPSPKSFAEARGAVINDYQAELEKQWVIQLKKKYPVTVNQKVLNELIKSRRW